MGENEQFGFVLGGLSKDIGSGGSGGDPSVGFADSSLCTREPIEALTPEEFRRLTEEVSKSSILDDLKGMPELFPTEDISAERVAAMVHYCTEHQTERFVELLEFFTAECRALFQEAWEATADADSNGQ